MRRTPTEDEKRQIRELFTEIPGSSCKDCGGYHMRACPRIKAQEWLGNGNRTKVEYWEHWDDSDVIYPEDVFDEPDKEEI